MANKTYAKDPWRERNLQFLRDLETFQDLKGSRVIKGGLLQGPLLDLAGECPEEMVKTYGPLLRSLDDLFLVEYDAVSFNRAYKSLQGYLGVLCGKGEPRLIHNNIYHILRNLSEEGSSVAALILDTTTKASAKWWYDGNSAPGGENWDTLWENFIRPTIKVRGACPIVLNLVFDGVYEKEGAGSPLEALDSMFTAAFHQLKKVSPTLDKSKVCPRKTEIQKFTEDHAKTGSLGPFEVYRSESKPTLEPLNGSPSSGKGSRPRWRMITLRAVFTENKVLFDKARV